MNQLDATRQAALRDAFLGGMGVREAARTVGCAKATARRYRKELAASGALDGVTCACGKKPGHRGWCSYRFARSPERQRVMARLHGNDVRARDSTTERCPVCGNGRMIEMSTDGNGRLVETPQPCRHCNGTKERVAERMSDTTAAEKAKRPKDAAPAPTPAREPPAPATARAAERRQEPGSNAAEPEPSTGTKPRVKLPTVSADDPKVTITVGDSTITAERVDEDGRYWRMVADAEVSAFALNMVVSDLWEAVLAQQKHEDPETGDMRGAPLQRIYDEIHSLNFKMRWALDQAGIKLDR